MGDEKILDYKKSRFIQYIGEALSFIALFVAYEINKNTTYKVFLFILGWIILTLAILQYYAFCNCPYCGHHFSIKNKLPNYCPECGKKLE